MNKKIFFVRFRKEDLRDNNIDIWLDEDQVERHNIKIQRSKPILFSLIIIFIFLISCNDRQSNSTQDTLHQDPTQESSSGENPPINVDTSNIKPSNPINNIKKREDEHNNTVIDSLALLESKIVFDSNFNPFLFVKLKNNMKEGVIALEVIIDPKGNDKETCKKLIIKKKISIPPNKIVTFKERIHDKVESGCHEIEYADIYLRDCVLTNGRKTKSRYSDLERLAKELMKNR